MSDTQTVVVTGGAGFIGSHLVDALIAAGHRVMVIDDLSTGRQANVNPEAELHVLDIRSEAAARLLADGGVDAVFHQAAQMDVRRSTEDPKFDAEINILGTLNLLQAAVEGKVRQILFASTGGAIYGEQETFPAPESHATRPLSPYGVAKLACERYLDYFHLSYGLDVACLRYANVYGERQNPKGEAGVIAIFLDRLLSGGTPTINGDGLQTRDYIHVSDVVRANLALLGKPGFHVYNVGTGSETTVVELFQRLCRAVGRELDAVHGPGKPGEQRRSVIDGGLLRRDFGLPTPLALADGLERTATWFRERAR